MKNSKFLIIILIALVAVAFPQIIQDPYILRLAVMSGLFILLASAHNILMKVGQLSLGPVAFYGIGAYVSAILTTRYHIPFIGGFIAAGVVATLFGWVIGRLTLKMRSAYFVIVTLGFAEFFRQVALNWTDMTNGPMGITAVPAPLPSFNEGYGLFYYSILVLVIVTIYGLYRMEHSTIGRAMKAIRENEPLAQSVGINNYKYMMLATLLSSLIIGLAGSFYSGFFQFVGPEILGFDVTVTIIVMVVAGGRATLMGPILGAIIFTILPEILRAAMVWRMVIYGILLMLITLFMPDGIMAGLRLLLQQITLLLRTLPWFQPQPVMVGTPTAEFHTRSAIMAETSYMDRYSREISSRATEGLGKNTNTELLSIKNLCVFFGGVHAVDNISVTIKPCEIFAIIGPNGAGKTTILNAITRFGPITSGDITYKDQKLNSLSPHEIARLGIVRTFQHTNLFPTSTTKENLLLGHNSLEPEGLIENVLRSSRLKQSESEMNAWAEGILDFLQLRNYAETMAKGLPYGHQRLLEIGVSMAAAPEILLLDEPAAGLNSAEVNEMIKVIKRLQQQGITIILVEHDMKLVMEISDQILVLDHGKQIAIGRPEMIRNDERVVRAYLGKRRQNASII
jgi:branched-chain amino acid transport system permease protein